MKEFIKEFKEFAFKGNMMDLAVGMIIGAAFTALVNSVVSNLFMPLISLFTGGIDFSNLYLPLSEASKDAFMNGAVLPYGTFITDLIQFLILAFVVFLMIRALTKLMQTAKKEAEEAPATTKECPFCKTEINIDAVKCPNCTSDLK